MHRRRCYPLREPRDMAPSSEGRARARRRPTSCRMALARTSRTDHARRDRRYRVMARMDRIMGSRGLGIAAAVGCAVLYSLIGFGVLSVGGSTTEATTDLLGFGLLMAGF